jgi:hypothetical protein
MKKEKIKSLIIRILAHLYRRMIIIIQYFYSIRVRINRKKQIPMIFCIGFSKTGTTSLDKALYILGYRPIHWPRAHIKPRKGWIEYIKKSPYDAFSDAPIYFSGFFKELDKEFPNSKFILTVRDPKSLLKSWENYFSNAPWAVDSKEEKNNLIKEYNDHKKDVLEYFKDKSSQLLVFDIFGEDGWNKLCKFLNKPTPNVPFPHERKTKYTTKKE